MLISPRPKANGHDKNPDAPGATFEDEDKGPINVEQRLAAMHYLGPGNRGIHRTQLQCTASLLRSGCPTEDVVDRVLGATQAAVAKDARTAKWDWNAERLAIQRMCFDLISKNPELSVLLPDDLGARFEEALANGRTPRVVFA